MTDQNDLLDAAIRSTRKHAQALIDDPTLAARLDAQFGTDLVARPLATDEQIAQSEIHTWDGVPDGPSLDDLTASDWVCDLNLRIAQAVKRGEPVELTVGEARAIAKVLVR